MNDKLSDIEERLNKIRKDDGEIKYKKNSPVKRFFGKLFLYSALFGGIAYLGDMKNVKRWTDNHIRYAMCPKSSETVDDLDNYNLEIRVKKDQKALYLVNTEKGIERIVRPEGYVGSKGENFKNKWNDFQEYLKKGFDNLQDEIKDFGADMYKKFN